MSKLYVITCKNCRREICRTDGTFLFVENLEVLPKTRAVRRSKSAHQSHDLTCAACRHENRIYLKIAEPERREARGGKFSIFRSRFD